MTTRELAKKYASEWSEDLSPALENDFYRALREALETVRDSKIDVTNRLAHGVNCSVIWACEQYEPINCTCDVVEKQQSAARRLDEWMKELER